MAEPFRIGLTRDLRTPDGMPGLGDIGLGLLHDVPGIKWEFLREDSTELTPDHINGFDGLAVLGPRIGSETLDAVGRLAIIARFGVGYDSIDVDACTRNGVMLTITPDAVRRPMATAILTLILALSGRLLQKDGLTRSGRWSEKVNHMGLGLTGRVLGSIGFGNIGRELFRLASPLEMRHIAHDPYAQPDPGFGVELVDLDTLFRTADFVVVNCALTAETRHLVNADRIGLMMPSAYLINTARGPIVDQAALTVALNTGQIAGAGLDVFEQEPIDPDDPLLALDNVIVTPHALGWTDELMRLNGRHALSSILDVAAGQEPRHIVNRDVLESPRLREKLASITARRTA